MESFELLSKILTWISPFAILYLTWRNNRYDKRVSEQKAIEKELDDARRKEFYDKLDSATNMMLATQEQVRQLTERIETIDERDRSLQLALTEIEAVNKLNGRYTHQLASLVTVLAEGLRDQHLDGNITEAVRKYHEFESETIGSIVKGETSL